MGCMGLAMGPMPLSTLLEGIEVRGEGIEVRGARGVRGVRALRP